MAKVFMCSLTCLLLISCAQINRTPVSQTALVSPEPFTIPAPTKTSKVSPTNLVQSTPIPSSTWSPETQQRATIVYLSQDVCEKDLIDRYSSHKDISPDGQWAVMLCRGEQITLEVVGIENGKKWSFPNLVLEIGGDAIQTFFSVYHWSLDGNHLFFTPVYYVGDGGIFIGQPGLFQMDLETGNVKELLERSNLYDFAISPDDMLLAYNNYAKPNTVRIGDMKSTQERLIELPRIYVNAGLFVWTRDSKNIIFVAGLDQWREQNKGLSLFLYNIDTQDVSLLIDNDKRNLYPSSFPEPWLDENILLLRSATEPGLWKMDLDTHQISAHPNP